VKQTTDTLSLSSSVMCCCLYFSLFVPVTRRPHFLLLISVPCIPYWPSSSVAANAAAFGGICLSFCLYVRVSVLFVLSPFKVFFCTQVHLQNTVSREVRISRSSSQGQGDRSKTFIRS